MCAAVEFEQLGELEQIVSHRQFAPRQVIFEEGEPADYVFNVSSGNMRLYKLLADGRRQVTGFLQAGAQERIGSLYEEGRGVKQDLVQAHAWYDIAALRGAETAAISRDRVARKMTPVQIAEAKQIVREIGGRVGVPREITKHEVEPGASDARVCGMSTAYGEWLTAKSFENWVEEAHKRNLTLEDCEILLKAN